MKNFLIVIILFLSLQGFSQELNAVVKVTKDSIALKWLPNSFETFTKMTKGGSVSRIESGKVSDPKSLDFSNGKKFTIPTTSTIYNKLNEAQEEQDKFKVLLSPFIDGATDPEEKNFAFGAATIENVINPNFQYVVGNIIVDKDFDKSKTYYYKIDVGGLKPVYVFIDAKQITNYSNIKDFSLSLDKKKTVEVEWDYRAINKEAFGFTIFHAIDNTKQPKDLLGEPYLPFKSNFEPENKKGSIRHDNPIEGHFNYYRVSGLDPFGNPSLHSEWKKIYIPKMVHAFAEIQKIEAENELRKITAKIYTEGNLNPHVEKISLLRSLSKDSGYSVVKTLDYTDSIINITLSGKVSDDHFYYKIIAFNEDDTVSSLPYYFFTLDQTPPGAPTEITGTIDSFGIVSLSWKAPADKDIKGYRVYRGNALDEDFVEQTTRLTPETTFKDTLRLDNLTSQIYYFIRTVDNNYNNSVFSDTVLLIKPDTIAPVSVVLYEVSLVDSVFKINWVNSNSEDVKKNVLIRESNSINEILYTWSDTTTRFVDNNIVPGKGYNYLVKTYDLSDNESASKSIYRFYEPGYRNPLKGFKAKVNIDKKVVELSWSKPNEEVYSYVIYRGKKDEKLLPLKTITNGENFFNDKHVKINNAYTYTVKYVSKSGIHSLPVKQTIVYQ